MSRISISNSHRDRRLSKMRFLFQWFAKQRKFNYFIEIVTKQSSLSPEHIELCFFPAEYLDDSTKRSVSLVKEESPTAEAASTGALFGAQSDATPVSSCICQKVHANVHLVVDTSSKNSANASIDLSPVRAPPISGVENGELFRRREANRRSQYLQGSSFSSPGDGPVGGGQEPAFSFSELYRREVLSARTAPRVQLEELSCSIDAGDEAAETKSRKPPLPHTYINSPYVRRRLNAPSVEHLYYTTLSEPAGTPQGITSLSGSSCGRRASRASIVTVEDAIRYLKGEHEDNSSSSRSGSRGSGLRLDHSRQLELTFAPTTFDSFAHSQMLSWSSSLSPAGELLRATSEILPTVCELPTRINFSSTNLSSNSNSTPTPTSAFVLTSKCATGRTAQEGISITASSANSSYSENKKCNGDVVRRRLERRLSSSSSTSSTDTVLRAGVGSSNFKRKSPNVSPSVHLRTTAAQTDLMLPPSLQWPPLTSLNGPHSQANQWRHSLPLFLLEPAAHNGPYRPKSAHVDRSGNPLVTLSIQDDAEPGYVYSYGTGSEAGPDFVTHAYPLPPKPIRAGGVAAGAISSQHHNCSNSVSGPRETQCSQYSPSHCPGAFPPTGPTSNQTLRVGQQTRAPNQNPHRQCHSPCSGEISALTSDAAGANATLVGRRQHGFDLRAYRRISEEDRCFSSSSCCSASERQLANPQNSAHNN